tara:strand:+ start:466 stop:756 length:291 start_codon:yes stop_codon:yes gene_type:complete
MNLIDAVATAIWVSTGVASEINPLMANLLGIDSSLFILTKLTIVSLCVLLIWRLKMAKSAKLFVLPVFIAYLCVVGVHISIGFDLFKNEIPIIEGR